MNHTTHTIDAHIQSSKKGASNRPNSRQALGISEWRPGVENDIMKFLELGVYPNGANKRKCRSIRIMAMPYILCRGQLYRRSYDGIHLRCLKKEEAEKVMVIKGFVVLI